MPKVSIIIPAYNSENTINRTLTSVTEQSVVDVEIIAIDDGSTDGTVTLLREWASKDSRITVLTSNSNKGVGNARNCGLEMASGEYIRFVDADDVMPKESTAKMIEAAEKNKADLVIGIIDKVNALKTRSFPATKRLGEMETIDRYAPELVHSFSLGNKLFKAEIINDNSIRFKSFKQAEDGCFVFEFIQKAEKICGCNTVVYKYYKPDFFE